MDSSNPDIYFTFQVGFIIEGRNPTTLIQNKTCKYNEKLLGFTNVRLFNFPLVAKART